MYELVFGQAEKHHMKTGPLLYFRLLEPSTDFFQNQVEASGSFASQLQGIGWGWGGQALAFARSVHVIVLKCCMKI